MSLQRVAGHAALERLHQVREAEPSWPGLRALVDEATALRNAELEPRRHEEQVRRGVAEVEALVARQELDRARTALDDVRRLERDTPRMRELAAKVDAAFEARRVEEARRRAEEERRRAEEEQRRAEEQQRRAEEERRRRLEQIALGREAFEAGQIDEGRCRCSKRWRRRRKTSPASPSSCSRSGARDERLEAERRAARERARRIAAALDRARKHLGAGEFDSADKAVREALAIDASHADALATETQIAAALTERVDSLIQSAQADVTRGRHAKAVETLERAGIRHARLDAELERVRAALAAQVLEQRVDEAIKERAREPFPEAFAQGDAGAARAGGSLSPEARSGIQAARRAVAHAGTAATPVEPRSNRLVLAGVGGIVLVVAILAIRQFWPSTGDAGGAQPPPVTTATPGNQPPSSSIPSTTGTGTPVTPPVTTASPGASTPPSASPQPTPSRAELATTAATGIDTLLAQADHERALIAAASAATLFGDEPAVRNALGRLASRAREDASRARGRDPRRGGLRSDPGQHRRSTLRIGPVGPGGRWTRRGASGRPNRCSPRRRRRASPRPPRRRARNRPKRGGPPRVEPQVETRENQSAAPRQLPSQSVPAPQPVTPPANTQQSAPSEPPRTTQQQPPPFDAAAVQRTARCVGGGVHDPGRRKRDRCVSEPRTARATRADVQGFEQLRD